MLNIEKKRGGKFSVRVGWEPVNLDVFINDTMGITRERFRITKNKNFETVTFTTIEDATRFALVADRCRI